MLLGFCATLPVSAQIPNVRNAVDRKVDEAYAAMRARRKAEEAAKTKQRQVEQQVESTVQLGVRKNQQQAKKLENSYGVKDLEEMVEAKPQPKTRGRVITKSRADAPWKRMNGGNASRQATSAEMEELKAIESGSRRIATSLEQGGSVEEADAANKYLWQNGSLDGLDKKAAEEPRADNGSSSQLATSVHTAKSKTPLDSLKKKAKRDKAVADFLKNGGASEVSVALMKKGYVDVSFKKYGKSIRAAQQTEGLVVRRLKNGLFRIFFSLDTLKGK